MVGFTVRTLLSAALAGSMVIAGAAGAQADDGDRWDRDHRAHWYVEERSWAHDRREPRHDVPDYRYRPVETRYVEAPPLIIPERQPVYIMPAPVMAAPVYQAPVYAPPAAPSLNFNFTLPLR